MTFLKSLKGKKLYALVFVGVIVILTKIIGTFAQTPQATLFITGPNDLSTVSSGTYKIVLNSGSESVGFASVEISFDKTKLNLSTPVSVTGPLKNQIIISSQSDANASGTVTIVLGLSPQDRDNPPSGEMELATLEFSKVETPSGNTSLAFNAQNLSVINMSAQGLTVGSQDFDISFDVPSQTPTPTLTPAETITPTNSPSPEATPTNTPTPTITPTLTPTVTPTPTQTQTPTPTASVTPTPTPAENKPATLSLFPNGDFKVSKESLIDLSLSISSPVIGVDAVINYDPQILEIISVGNSGLFDGNFTYLDNKNGTLRISATMSPTHSIVAAGVMAGIVVKPKVAGSTILDFVFVDGSKAESNVISADGADLLTFVNGTILDIANIDIFAYLSLKTPSENKTAGYTLEGSVGIINGDWQKEFTTDKDGNSQTWQLDYRYLGTTQPFSLKTKGFLRKRLDAKILEGTNILNFGNLVAGDLNDDGVVNNVDVAIMYQSWFGTGTADYNKDGIVNSYDFWILVSSFFKEDE